MICIVGGKGRIGRRYACILRSLHIPHVIYDIDTPEIDLYSYDKFIISTPTDTHIKFLKELEGNTILIEKPVSKNPFEIPVFPKAFTVCNWKYTAEIMKQTPPYSMSYSYYQTGPDGLYWDLSQILYMDPDAKIDNLSPKWNVQINGNFVSYRILEESYIRMISDFVNGNYQSLWTLAQGKEMSQIVFDRIQRDKNEKMLPM